MPRKTSSTSGQSAKSQLKFGRQQSRSDFNGSPKEPVRQKFISTNTSLFHVMAMISMGICRKITNYRLIRQRLVIYLCLVLIGGILNDFAPLLARSFMFKVQKTNVLNQWFVKLGWLWTTVLTLPMMALTSLILTSDKQSATNGLTTSDNNTNTTKLRQILSYMRTRQLLRLLINTIVWYISTSLFEDLTGSCQESDPENNVKTVCIANGYKWLPGFDISGHTFLLIFSNLILLEECAVMVGWEPFGHHLFEQMKNIESRAQVLHNERQFKLYNQFSMALRILFVLITVLSLIWDFMLVQTSIFYHTMFQKLVAAIWAVAAWALTYQFVYRVMAIDVRAPKFDKNT